MIYFIALAILVASRLAAGHSKNIQSFLFYALSLLLFIFVGFRNGVGCDWYSYGQYATAHYSGILDALDQRDPLFHLLIYFLDILDLPFYPAVNVFCAAVFLLGIVALARRLADKLSFLLYLFPVAIVTLAMSGLRQAIATGFLMLALRAVMDRRPLRFVVLVLLASGFHGSAFIFLLLWPLITPMRRETKVGLLILISVPAAILFSSSATVDTAIDRYTGTTLDSAGAVFRLGMLAIGSLLYLALFKKHWAKADPSTFFVADFGAKASLLLLLILILPIPTASTVIVDRFGLYLSVFIAFALAAGPYISLDRNSRGTLIAAISFTYVVFFVAWANFGNKFHICYTPYSTYLLS
jgi:hypothetical protein